MMFLGSRSMLFQNGRTVTQLFDALSAGQASPHRQKFADVGVCLKMGYTLQITISMGWLESIGIFGIPYTLFSGKPFDWQTFWTNICSSLGLWNQQHSVCTFWLSPGKKVSHCLMVAGSWNWFMVKLQEGRPGQILEKPGFPVDFLFNPLKAAGKPVANSASPRASATQWCPALPSSRHKNSPMFAPTLREQGMVGETTALLYMGMSENGVYPQL